MELAKDSMKQAMGRLKLLEKWTKSLEKAKNWNETGLRSIEKVGIKGKLDWE